MKTRIVLASALFFGGVPFLPAQNPARPAAPPPAQATEPAVTDRGAHHKRYEWITVDETGLPHKHSYQEVATGLNFFDDQTGRWQDSVEEIELFNGAAIFRQGQFKIIFPRDISESPLDVMTPSPADKRMTSKILGLAYFDSVSGRSVMLATLKSSVGQLVQKNQLIYPDCFEGEEGVTADVRLTVTKAGFSQDVVIRPSVPPFPAPSEWGLPDDSHLVVMTEFMDAPEPAQVAKRQGVDLDFGSMRMETGKAFLDDNQDSSVPVFKTWELLDNRRFLVEAVRFADVKVSLEKLGRDAGIQTGKKTAKVQPKTQGKTVIASLASAQKLPVRTARLGNKRNDSIQLAALERRPGFTIDYNQITSNQTNYTFAGNITTYVSASLGLYGTTTIEPNTVIKFVESSSVKMTVNGPVVCLAGPYRPAVLTSVNDNEVGEALPGSTGTPANTTGATCLSDANTTTNSYQYLRFAYAGVGFEMTAEVGGLWHCQFYKCATGIKSTGTHAVNLYNVLLAQCTVGLNVSSTNAYGQHVTLDQSTIALTNATAGYFTNCIVTASTGTNTLQLNSSFMSSSSSGIYQKVGGASYYLVAGSTNCNIGSSNINATLKADLAKLTVFGPLVYSNATLSVPTTLSPQATRDSDALDLGYHYPPLDYAFGGTDGNTNLTFTAGTAVGWFRTTSGFYHAGHGLHMDDRQVVTFDGTAEAPCYWVRCNVVQEGNGLWLRGSGAGGLTGWADQYAYDVTRSPELRARFTRFSVMAYDENHFRDDWGYLIVRATHSEFLSGGAGGYIISLYLTNCLVDRVGVAQNAGWTGNEFQFRNVTFHGGDLSYNRYASAMPVGVRDTAFDGTTFSVSDSYASNPTYTYYTNNAYLTNGPFSNPTNVNDVRVSSFNWQTSSLGRFYLPTNSTLINAGSRNATNAGLYHFTTQTNQVKETNSTVDIGYHYVAFSPPDAKVVFVGADSATQGDWKGRYGGDGYDIFQDASSYPAYASVSPAGKADYVWDSSPASSRALQRATSGRIAACYYSYTPFTLTLSQTGSTAHRLALYFVDWDSYARSENVEIKDSISGTVYNTQGLTNFNGGVYLIWDIRGDATITITPVVGNGVISGLFFSTVNQTTWDLDGDGVPDYLEDANGNGSVDTGETDWQSSTDLGLKVWITEPKPNSTIP